MKMKGRQHCDNELATEILASRRIILLRLVFCFGTKFYDFSLTAHSLNKNYIWNYVDTHMKINYLEN